jgi:hypothetical protein
LVLQSNVGLTNGLPCGAGAIEERFLVQPHRDWWAQTQRLLPKVALFPKQNPREKRVLTRLELLSEGELVEYLEMSGEQRTPSGPNKSLQPTSTAVMPPAAQEIMPAVDVAEH